MYSNIILKIKFKNYYFFIQIKLYIRGNFLLFWKRRNNVFKYDFKNQVCNPITIKNNYSNIIGILVFEYIVLNKNFL